MLHDDAFGARAIAAARPDQIVIDLTKGARPKAAQRSETRFTPSPEAAERLRELT